jgi:hypothetical protein
METENELDQLLAPAELRGDMDAATQFSFFVILFLFLESIAANGFMNPPGNY